MIYTIQRAKLIAEQLRKFSNSNSSMVVGQFTNLNFWMAEVKSTLKAIDQLWLNLMSRLIYLKYVST